MDAPLLLLVPSALGPLASTPHSSVSLLRLRLRFGLPRRITLGDAFRVAVDLVDEMAQPPVSPHCHELQLFFSLAPANDEDEESRAVSGLRLRTRTVNTPSARGFHWRADCVVSADAASPLPAAFRLRVTCKAASPLPHLSSPSPPPVPELQRFCVDSQWFPLTPNASALILPVLSDEITFASSPPSPPPSSAISSRCLRIFALPAPLGRVHIEEDYGHAMGAHIWDASIWLGLSLVLSSSSTVAPPWPRSVVELGAGCGLVACVLARLAPAGICLAVLATERRDALSLLQANVCRNGVSSIVEGRELVWGPLSADSVLPTPDVVLAADVLYHWSAHEALLATLRCLPTQVLIAHKRRSAATSERLDCVVTTGVDDQCDACAWRQWHVARLVRVAGDVDLLQLTPRG